MIRWRLLSAPPRTGAHNMARDVALMHRAKETGEIVFSAYGWSTPTLSLGRNQRAKGCYDLERIKSMGVDIVRRPTGGRALLHHRELTYSVTAPLEFGANLRDSYKRINRILLDGLRNLGVGASVANVTAPSLPPTDIPCFAAPARGELITDGRKLVGSAQWRDENALLQHGSILIEDDQSIIREFSVCANDRDEIPKPATLKSALGRAPDPSEIADAMFDSVLSLEDSAAEPLDESEVFAATLREVPHFENELWTWRR